MEFRKHILYDLHHQSKPFFRINSEQRYLREASNWWIRKKISKAEARLLKITEINAAIDQKIALYRVPLQQIKLVYGQNKGKTYTEEEDRFLVRLFQVLLIYQVGNASKI